MFDNKDTLYIIPLVKDISPSLLDVIKNNSNILLLDNNIINKKTLPNKYRFNIMKFSEEWGDFVLKSKYKYFCFINQNLVCKDIKRNNIIDFIITITYNYTQKTNYKHVFNRILAFDKEYANSFLNMPLNGFKSNIELINYSNLRNIKYRIIDQRINSGITGVFNSIKILLSSIAINIIPYIFSIIFFMIFYNLIKISNPLEDILVSNVLGGVVGVVLYIILNYSPYFKESLLRSNIIDILVKIVKICISGYIIYVLYKLIGIHLIIAKILSDILFLVGVEIVKLKIPISI